MIYISKGSMTIKVPRGAFESSFKRAGWQETTGSPTVGLSEELKITQAEPETSTQEDSSKEVDEEADDSEETEEEEDESLEERPLSTLNMDELRQLAALYNINTDGMTTKKVLKEAIKAAKEE